MRTHVRNWGNSLAVRIPRALAQEAGTAADMEVELRVCNGDMVISQLGRPHYTLDELLAGITEDNLHGEWAIGPPVGKEVW